jgi:hypothetical protein
MKAVIKAEKKAKRKGKGKHVKEDHHDLQEDFSINTSDARFNAIHEDPNFAIDPSNPQFVLSFFPVYSSHSRGQL